MYLQKNGNVYKNVKKEETCKNNMVSAKKWDRSAQNDIYMYIYKAHLIVPTTPAACGGTGSSVKRSENWSHPIPSIGLGRKTTTTTPPPKVQHIPLVSKITLHQQFFSKFNFHFYVFKECFSRILSSYDQCLQWLSEMWFFFFHFNV